MFYIKEYLPELSDGYNENDANRFIDRSIRPNSRFLGYYLHLYPAKPQLGVMYSNFLRFANEIEDSSGKRAKEHAFNALFWPVLVGAILFDFLALCNLVPTHSQHLYRPYMLSGVQFKRSLKFITLSSMSFESRKLITFLKSGFRRLDL
uniref:Uncharacterized protein n=1 Tax=Glossina brevipalpis TaxID=37001 RepID=A0A1A9W350_9MUSC